MNNKVILISIDGMRPDGALQCGNPFVRMLMEKASYTLEGHSVLPTVTLPCHTSMFYGVPPQRHGVLTNVYTPLVRPIPGIAELLSAAGKTCAAFYNWESIRHIWSSECMKYTSYVGAYEEENSDLMLTRQVIALIRRKQPDFLFLHLVETDEKGGHDHGWMSPQYLRQLSNAFDCVKEIWEAVEGSYHIIVTADHGGHGRMHGEDCPEDFTIPMFFYGAAFRPGQRLEKAGLLDLAPTIADLMGVSIPREWEGRSMIWQNHHEGRR